MQSVILSVAIYSGMLSAAAFDKVPVDSRIVIRDCVGEGSFRMYVGKELVLAFGLLDYGTPGINGFDLSRSLKKLGHDRGGIVVRIVPESGSRIRFDRMEVFPK